MFRTEFETVKPNKRRFRIKRRDWKVIKTFYKLLDIADSKTGIFTIDTNTLTANLPINAFYERREQLPGCALTVQLCWDSSRRASGMIHVNINDARGILAHKSTIFKTIPDRTLLREEIQQTMKLAVDKLSTSVTA